MTRIVRWVAEGRVSPAEADAFFKLLDDFYSAPSVPWEAIDGRQIGVCIKQIVPDLKRRAAEQEKEQPGAQKLSLSEIWRKVPYPSQLKLCGLDEPLRTPRTPGQWPLTGG